MGERAKWRKGEDDSDNLGSTVIGCCIAVHKELGSGFLESVYHRALEIEFAERGVPFETQKEVGVQYHGHCVGDHRLDFLVGSRLVVELKTVETLDRNHYAQVRSYLNAAGQTVGLLVNFATFPVDVRRVKLK